MGRVYGFGGWLEGETPRYAHRVVAYFETESKLPVRFEAYDAPKTPGAEGELIEMQAVVGVKLNVGLGERDFDR